MSWLSKIFRKQRRAGDKTQGTDGFRIATQKEIWGDLAPLVNEASRAPHSADALLAFADNVTDAIARNATTPWSVPVGAISHRWLGHCGALTNDAAVKAYAEPFREAYRRRPEPYTAVMLAQACFNIADAVHDADWPKSGPALAREWNVRGCEALMAQSDVVALDENRPFDHQHYPWYVQYYTSTTRMTCALGDVTATFQQVYPLDPNNLDLLRLHGTQLLSAQKGRDVAALDTFARWAVEQTKGTYARGAYAYIYGSLANIDGIAFDSTLINIDLLEAGYLDLIDRFPSTRLANEHARALSWADERERLRAAFERGLRTIDYRAWGAGDELQGMEYARHALSMARRQT